MKVFALVCALLLASVAPSAAQTPLVYSSPAAWPFLSAQGHWGDDILGPFMLSHVHVECTMPAFGTVARTAQTFDCQFVMFHLDGGIGLIYGDMVSNVVLTEPGPMIGDPMGVVTRHAKVTFDPAMSQDLDSSFRNAPVHGWWELRLGARAFLTSGVVTNTELFVPVFINDDPTAPIPTWASGPTLRASIDGNSPRSILNGYGLHVSEYHDILPLNLPLTSKLEVTGFTYAYGVAPNLPQMGLWQQVNDPDLHHGVIGTVVKQISAIGGATSTVVVDPAILSVGTHAVALDWDQQTGAGNADFHANEQMTSRLVVKFTVGDGGVTPTPTPDPTPTPTPTWATFTPTFQRLDNSVRLCAPDGACVVLGTVTH